MRIESCENKAKLLWRKFMKQKTLLLCVQFFRSDDQSQISWRRTAMTSGCTFRLERIFLAVRLDQV